MANSPARSVVDVGTVIAGTYKIEALIGRGGMGAVFLASHVRLPGKQVAIKLLHAEIQDDEVLARFRREAEIASRLGHPNIVAVHDFNVMADGTPYLVLDYLHGETLAQRLQAGPMSIEQTLSIMRQVGSALQAAHREGIVHRDLKPHNIFLVPTEVDGRLIEIAKVLDFGISKIRGSQTVKTQESSLLGTPQYMAPEQATGQHTSVDERTDVFALGAIVHEMVTGQPAFTGASIPEVVFKVVYEQPTALPDTIPSAVTSAVKKAMEKKSDDRFPTVGAFVEALTGTPLTQLRPALMAAPEVGFATGSKNIANRDALAHTMDSGGFATPLARPQVDAGAATVSSLDIKSAPTLASSTAQRDLAQGPTLTPTTAPPIAVPAREPAGRRVWPLIAVGALAIAATAAVMFFVMGNDKPPRREKPPERVAVEPPPREAPPPRVDTVVPPDAAEPEVAKPDKPKRDKPKRDKVVEEKETAPVDPANAELETLLAQAEAAHARGERADALRMVNKILNLGGNSRTAAEALVLRGTIQCNDITQANGDLRQLRRWPKLAAKLRAACPALQ